MFLRPYAMALDTLHVAEGKWNFYSHGLVLSLLDVDADPDGSKSVTALHNHFQSKSAQSSETGPTSSSSGNSEDVSPAKPQPATDDVTPS